MKFFKKNTIEVAIFFSFLLYFGVWLTLNGSTIVSNNDELSQAVNYYNFTPHLSNFIDNRSLKQ